jgi:DNA-binding PadR family transcriptional regulator
MTSRRSSLAIAILVLLVEKPRHPYRMQQLIKTRGIDRVINVRQRASIYQTIERLKRDGLIVVHSASKHESRPERTVYELTSQGRETSFAWLREMLSSPKQEFLEFPAAISFLALLTPEEARSLLELRTKALANELTQIDAELETHLSFLPRLFLLEQQYLRSSLAAELEWVRSVVDDLRSGCLTWSPEWLNEIAAKLEGSEPQATK